MEQISENEKQLQKANYIRQYYIDNKEILQQKYKSRVKCPLCDKEVSKASLNAHLKSQLCVKGQEIKRKLKTINA